MVKLFALILAASDTGSVAMSQAITDFPDQFSCEQAVERMYHAPQKQLLLGGHAITVKIVAECVR